MKTNEEIVKSIWEDARSSNEYKLVNFQRKAMKADATIN